MCCNNKFAVIPDNASDLLTDVLGSSITPVTIAQYGTAIGNVGTYWLEPDANGNIHLCFNGGLNTSKDFIFTDAQGNNAYTVQAVDFVGGRPPVIRK